MGIRPLSAASDLEEELQNLMDETLAAGLDCDQVEDITKKALRNWMKGAVKPVGTCGKCNVTLFNNSGREDGPDGLFCFPRCR
jgi:hypothetical protein